MNSRTALTLAFAAAALASAIVVSGAGSATDPGLTISGVSGNGLIPFAPVTLTMSQLAALPKQMENVTIGGVLTAESGPLLSSVLAQSGFASIPGCKNDELRYWIEATGSGGASAEVTAGELDPSFGNNQAILSLTENGNSLASPRLVVPNKDASGVRDIEDVVAITVGRAPLQLADTATTSCNPPSFTPPVSPTPPTGTVVVNGDVSNPLTLDYTELGALTQVSQTDTYQAKKSTTVSESGPTLHSVLEQADPEFLSVDPNDSNRFYVEITSSEDGYVATLSWAEIDPATIGTAAGNQPLLSLLENGKPTDQPTPTGTGDTDPRSTAPGDIDGGRYNFGAAVITLLQAPLTLPQGENLNGADLQDVNLQNATLQGNNLHGADLQGANLQGANVHGVNLNGANLTDANLDGATLQGANTNKVTWSNTTCPDGTNSDSDGGSCAGHGT